MYVCIGASLFVLIAPNVICLQSDLISQLQERIEGLNSELFTYLGVMQRDAAAVPLDSDGVRVFSSALYSNGIILSNEQCVSFDHVAYR